MNPLRELNKLGQSIWFDNIRRGLIISGELQRMISDCALTGVTSNPTIFERAVSGTGDYDEAISELIREGKNEYEILERIFTEDIRMAADLFLPVYEATKGRDGFVSIEVSPALARDTEKTMEEARTLFRLVGRPNVMVKVPATKEGLPAIERLIEEGCNINVTLLFSVKRYEEVALAYIRGLEKRSQNKKPLERIASVASFFVSRVDTLVDRLLEERLEAASTEKEKERIKGLMGRAAVANARLAYKKFIEIFSSERFKRLEEQGARPQKLLWASTGTKNHAYSDIKYVEELIAEGTVNTMPLNTMKAFLDHGKVRPTLAEGIDEAERVIDEISKLGIDMEDAARRLEADGVRLFYESFEALVDCIRAKKKALATGAKRTTFSLKGFEDAVSEALRGLEKKDFLRRLWNKDETLWKEEEDHRRIIKKALGWLTVPEVMEGEAEDLKTFAERIREDGFKDVVLLGMGGSSLAPLVFARVFGRVQGYPALRVLDSTDPSAIKTLTDSLDLDRTLFIVSSKSGTTIEPLSFFEFFYEKVKEIKGEKAGGNFTAITDPGTPLEALAKERGFRRTFLNPPDIGGRFSALSFFGLVPAALSGIDVSRLLEHAGRMIEATEPCAGYSKNTPLRLGAALGVLSEKGRNKVTFCLSDEIESFGLWIEQLLAESTGKEGKGLVPVTGEPRGRPEVYGDDRVFISMALGQRDADTEGWLKKLEGAGHPVVRINLEDPYELGGEFFLWEAATATAGTILNINPFDQPDVEEAKKRMRALLEKGAGEEGSFEEGPAVEGGNISISFTGSTLKRLPELKDKKDIHEALSIFIGAARKGDYFGVLAYLNPFDGSIEEVLVDIRRVLRDSTRRATQLGFGPRYLHSTGQLHKGGPDKGVFLILLHKGDDDIPVPGKGYTFSELEHAQGLGDAQALASKGRRVAIVNLKDGSPETLKGFLMLLEKALKRSGA